MRFAADLHLHSRYASGVSPAMTMENIALWAQRKGVDLLGTGDCLQPQWLDEIEANTVEAEPGFLALKPEVERAVHARLPEKLRRSLRFVLSTEVNCVTGADEMKGIHQLIYFPALTTAREFAERVGKLGNLVEGRPTLALSAAKLVRGAANFDRVHIVAPHVMNPWFSVFGVVAGKTSAEGVYGDELVNLWAIETGLTSNPLMCRRVPGLDRFGLVSNSDAHSLENIGRECTLIDIEPSYDALMAALRGGTKMHGVGATLKFPLELTRYFLNWCSHCKEPFDAWPACPQCRRKLTKGARDRMSEIEAVRSAPEFPGDAPPFETLRPLSYVIADVEKKKPDTVGVRKAAGEIVDRVGHERYVLTEATAGELLAATTPEIAQAIVNQRSGAVSRRLGSGEIALGQGGFDF
ncbi:endonuclease Q family protein [Oleiharenicola lentus]|uniref:endonuclease Q family protein n=1 Tax=Oleiharenicola lentus TaxID=2508720 RepID=UPI003F662474